MDYGTDTTKDRIKSTGGTALIGKLLERIDFGHNVVPKKEEEFHRDALKSFVGLFVQAKTKFEDIKIFQDDDLFTEALGIDKIPAKETLRLYLEQMIPHSHLVHTEVSRSSLKLLSKTQFTPVAGEEGRTYIPVDIDTSPMDNSKSKKEGVSRTYKKFDGYHPIFAYIGSEGYMLDCELRIGKQHCQKGTPKFLGGVMKRLKKLKKALHAPVLFRFDSGNDAHSILDPLMQSGHQFIVKRNLRKESREQWLERAKSLGKVIFHDEHKTVYTGVFTGLTPKQDPDFPATDVVFEVTERYTDKKTGQPLLMNDISVDTYWTNMYESADTVIALYHDHGTSEQFHSELKTDMLVEKFPSGKFACNAMLLKLALLSYNLLRFTGQTALQFPESLPYQTEAKRKRLRKVIDDLIRISVKVVSHARKDWLKFWKKDPWQECFRLVYDQFCAL